MTFTEPLPFEEAIAIARERGILPTTLSSAELRELGGALKRRAVFSAKLAVADQLQLLDDLTTKIAGGLTEEGHVAGAGAGSETDRMISIAEAKAQLLENLPPALRFGGDGSVRDFASDARLQLQVETNVLDTLGHARWQAQQDPVSLDVNPALELVRMVDAVAPRDWQERWAAARAASSEEGATDGGDRMVALKNHPIWQALGDGAGGYTDTLGNPWPPFAFNSGMNVVDVSREDAIALGLLDEFTVVPPQSEEDLNEGLAVNADRFSDALRQQLAADPDLQLRDGVLTVRRAA